jgi:hypothetical protein
MEYSNDGMLGKDEKNMEDRKGEFGMWIKLKA